MLPIERVPSFAATEEQLEFFIGRNELRLGEVYETVKGELDLVTKFVGASDDSVKGFTNLDGGSG
jgi:hypothetical protein